MSTRALAAVLRLSYLVSVCMLVLLHAMAQCRYRIGSDAVNIVICAGAVEGHGAGPAADNTLHSRAVRGAAAMP